MPKPKKADPDSPYTQLATQYAEIAVLKGDNAKMRKALGAIAEELTSKRAAGFFCDLCNLTAKIAEQALKEVGDG